MRIGIDARLMNETGVGRYIRNLLAELAAADKKNTYIIFLPSSAYDVFLPPNRRFEKRRCDIHWHTVKEQLSMPGIFLSEHLDVLHVPYFNAPLFYPKPYVITIHDLTILHVTTGKATTLPKPFYWIRRIGYQIILRFGVRNARHIIAVSNATKQDLIKSLGVRQEKISVTYEGVDKQIVGRTSPVAAAKPPYFLYVGNAYPHKNLEFLIRSFGRYREQQTKTTDRLVLVGNNDFFYKRLKTWVATLPYKDHITFFGPADDRELGALYTHATAFVYPSLMEGFGLPALEAMKLGTPVVCSDIPVFHELFGSIPLYIDPQSELSLIEALEEVETKKKKQLTDEEKKLIGSYRWDTMAKETLAVYEHITV